MDDKLKKAVLQIALYFTDEPEVLKHDLKKAGTIESMHYHDDFNLIIPAFNQLIEEGAKFEFDRLGITIKYKNDRTTSIPWYTNKAETYFWTCWFYISQKD